MNNQNDKIKELISAYIDGCTSGEEKKQVEDLIINSKEWQTYYKELQKLSVTLKDWTEEAVSPDLTSRIQKTLLQDKLREGYAMKRKSKITLGGGVLVTVCVCFLIGVIYMKNYSQGRLKGAADDIGDQFTAGNIDKNYGTKSAKRKGDYEPYYLTSDYEIPSTVSKDQDGVDLKGLYSKAPQPSVEISKKIGGEKKMLSKRSGKVYGKFANKDGGGVQKAGTMEDSTQVSESALVRGKTGSLDGRTAYGVGGGYNISQSELSESESTKLAYAPKLKGEVQSQKLAEVVVPRASNEDASKQVRSRSQGGFQQSSYDTSLGLINGLGESQEVDHVRTEQRQTQAFWNPSTVGESTVSESGRRDPTLSEEQIAYNAPTTVAPRRESFDNQYKRQYPSDEPREKNEMARGIRGNDYRDGKSHYRGDVRDHIIYDDRDRYDDELIYQPQHRPYIRRYPPKQNKEEYTPIYENPFLQPNQSPLSTFSVDVDTASYSNVRRFLNNNQMPPADAVRIEEMINYFDYNYARPKRGELFSVNTYAAVCPWNKAHHLVMVGLQGSVPSERKIPPSNLVFLVDISGSMNRNDKLPLLKRSLKKMVEQLRPDQRIAIVAYSGRAGLILDSTSGAYKSRIHAAIDGMRAGGSTAGEAGLQLAYRVARDNFIRHGNNRVIMATDGDFNVGISSDHELVRLIEQRRKDGIFLSILGFGTGNLKDAKMEKIANNGNGNYHYIDSIQEGEKVLVHELGSTLFTIAKDVKIQVEFNPQTVHAYRLIGYENRLLGRRDFNNDRVDAGEIGAGHTVTALYEVVPTGAIYRNERGVDRLTYQKPRFFKDPDLMTVKLRYKHPKGNRSKLLKRVIRQDDVKSRANENLRFAAAVAEFGMLLRNSRYKGYASYEHVLQEAYRSLGTDQDGYRGEFIRLVEQAKQLDYRRPEYPRPYDERDPYPIYDDYPAQTPPMQFK